MDLLNEIRHLIRKPDFGVSNQIRHKLGCTTTEDGLKIAVSAQPICIFFSSYAESRFSHDTPQIMVPYGV